MNVAVAYCYPMVDMRKHRPLAQRFASTWRMYAPPVDTRLVIVCNGSNPTKTDRAVFDGINCSFHVRDNFGWDIGAFQWAAKAIPCDILVCLGAYCHFYMTGWMERIVSSVVENGPNYYGCWGYQYPNPHIRTTAFWLPPDLLNAYPYVVGTSKKERYKFEHGAESFTKFVIQNGFDASVVSWDDVHPNPETWGNAKMGIGDCLLLDQFTHR